MRAQLKGSFSGAVVCVALTSAVHSADLQPVLKAPPEQQATGYVEIYSGWASSKSETLFCIGLECVLPSSFRDNGWVLGGAGRGSYWISRDMSVQVDAQAEGTSYGSPGGHFSSHSYLVGGHWSWRNPQQYLFGLFAAVGDAGGGSLFDSQRHGLIGAEAQWYWNQFTLYVQGGYDSTLGPVDSGTDNINAWFVRGTGRYFINPNFLIEGGVMYDSGSIDHPGGVSSDFRTWSWGVKGEWRFPTAPFSVYAKYQGSETKYDSDVHHYGFQNATVTDHRVLLGLKLHMGDRTLQQTDRAGATLDIVSPLANPTSPLMFGVFSR
jgi:hypothetical protein